MNSSLIARRISRLFLRSKVVCVLPLFLLFAPPVAATTVYDGFGDHYVDLTVNSAVYFNGDLIVGGNFGWAGGETGSRFLARWDGTGWKGMNMPGAGPPPPTMYAGSVEVLAVHQGELFIGGHMRSDHGAPSDNIIRWDGTNWKGLNYGVNGTVYALLSSGNDLYVGGDFFSAGAVPMSHVARWDGTGWNALGSGLNGVVYGLVEFGGEIVAGGSFDFGGTQVQVAAWNGSTWHAIGQPFGVPDYVFNLAVFNGVLVAGGRFTLQGGNNLAWLDGNVWKPLGGGAGNFESHEVTALAVVGAKLYVGGDFVDVGTGATNLSVNRVATWDGTGWSSLSTGIQTGCCSGACNDLSVNGSNVVVGGNFELAGGLDAPNLAIWDGSTWSNVPSNYSKNLNGPAKAFLNSGGALIVGGSFTWASGHRANRIAKWNGGWAVYGSGFDDGQVNVLADLNGSIVAGGSFTISGGQAVNRIAIWNGTSWTPMGAGFNTSVLALAVYNGQLVAGGPFTMAGGQAANRIAQWDGTAWHPMGGFNNSVNVLAIYNGDLYAGGNFTGGIAKWSGSTWTNVTPFGFMLPATSMAISNGELFVCGPNSLFRFNGTTWSSVNRPTKGPDYVADYFGLLVGSGGLSTSTADYGVIAVVPGTPWYMLVPTGTAVGPMLSHDGNFAKGLFVGGDFAQMGGVPSRGIALLNPELNPTAIEPEEPVASRLQASPNPFQHSLAIRFSLEAPTRVEMTVFDLAGHRVATVLDGNLPVGPHEVSWDGRDSQGQRAPAGVYFIRSREGDRVESQRVVLVD